VNMLSRITADGNVVSEQTQRVLVRNNLFIEVGRDPISRATGRSVQLLSDLKDVTIVQNTFFSELPAINSVSFSGLPQIRTVISNNLFGPSDYGIFGSDYGEGSKAIAHYMPNGVVTGNAIIGRSASAYPSGNSFPTALTGSEFVRPSTGDYTIRPTVSWSAFGGALVGIDGQKVLEATRTAVVP
jgi:hypothetical protein